MTLLLAFSHHILLGNFTVAHNYSVLFDGIFISVIGGYFLGEFLIKEKRINIKGIGIGILLALCVSQYYYINRPGDFSQNGDLYSNYKDIGDFMRKNSTEKDVLFTINLNEKPAPQIIYYAKRNFYQKNSMKEVREIINNRSIKSAKIFTIEKMKIKKLETITSE